jgi:hypothetical protein
VYVFPCSTVKASTSARHHYTTKTSAATKFAAWRTCRRCHLLLDEFVSDLTVGSDSEAPATSRRGPSKVAAPRRTRHLRERYPPPRSRPKSRRRRRGGGSGPGPRCRWTPPRRVPTSKPSTLKKTRAMCSYRRQQRLRRREARRRRRPARRLGCLGYPHRAPAQRTMQGRTRG